MAVTVWLTLLHPPFCQICDQGPITSSLCYLLSERHQWSWLTIKAALTDGLLLCWSYCRCFGLLSVQKLKHTCHFLFVPLKCTAGFLSLGEITDNYFPTNDVKKEYLNSRCVISTICNQPQQSWSKQAVCLELFFSHFSWIFNWILNCTICMLPLVSNVLTTFM